MRGRSPAFPSGLAGIFRTPAACCLLLQPPFSQTVSRLVGGNSLALCSEKDVQPCVVNLIHLGCSLGSLPAQQFATTVDDAAGVGIVIRSIKDSQSFKFVAVPWF